MTVRQVIALFPPFGFIVLGVLIACGPANHPASDPTREIARAAVLTTAEAVRLADVECARIVREKKDATLGEKCDAIYTKARTSLVAAAIAVDAWDKIEARENVTCTVIDATAQLTELARETATKGGQPQPVIEDAARLVKLLGSCTSTKKEAGAP